MPNTPLTTSERQNYETTISKLSSANNLQKFLIWLIFIIAAIGLIITIKTSDDASKRAEIEAQKRTALIQQIQTTANKQDALIESQLSIVNRHIDCVIAFFTVSDRNSVTLQDIDNCTFDRAGEKLQPHISTP